VERFMRQRDKTIHEVTRKITKNRERLRHLCNLWME
jgi:hypothetical protein